MATHLVWLRTDLRIHDNLALAAACRDPQAQVLALYIATRGSGVNITWRHGRPLYRQPFTESACRAGGTGHTAVGRRGGRFYRQRRTAGRFLPAASGQSPVLQLSVRIQ